MHSRSSPPPPTTTTSLQTLTASLNTAISIYLSHLTAESLPHPSFAPSSLKAPLNPKHPDGVASKKAIVELSQEICALVMDPGMNLLVCSLQFHFCSCLKVAIDLRVHEHVPRDGKITSTDLAAAVGAEEALLIRIMRVLTNKYIFTEPEKGYYAHTAMSWMICEKDMLYLLEHRLDEPFRSSSRQPDALAQSNYRSPHPHSAYGFQLAFSTPQNFWDYITTTDPSRGQRFARAMRAVNLNTLDVIPEMYPFDQLAAHGHGGLLVDVGGGLGQVGKRIVEVWGGKGVRCVVQDKFARDSEMCDGEDVRMMRCDFFEGQPVKEAAAYFFRHIFHDWPDPSCIQILRHTACAMSAQHSRILICDQVLDEVSPSVPSMLYDIDMMTLFGGKERTLLQWNELLREADERLYVRDVVRSEGGDTTIIEVRLRCGEGDENGDGGYDGVGVNGVKGVENGV